MLNAIRIKYGLYASLTVMSFILNLGLLNAGAQDKESSQATFYVY